MSSAVLEQQNIEPKKKTRFWNPGEYFDYSLLVIVLFLIGFGLVMVYSTSSYTASLRYQDAAYFLKRQGFFAVAGIIAMLFVSKIDYHFYKKVTGLAYLVALVLSIIVQFAGREAGGSSRWIQIGPVGFQPSEFAKVAIVLIMALATTNRVWKMNSFVTLLQIMFPSLLLTGIIAIENLSTAVICGVIIVAIVFVASPKITLKSKIPPKTHKNTINEREEPFALSLFAAGDSDALSPFMKFFSLSSSIFLR